MPATSVLASHLQIRDTEPPIGLPRTRNRQNLRRSGNSLKKSLQISRRALAPVEPDAHACRPMSEEPVRCARRGTHRALNSMVLWHAHRKPVVTHRKSCQIWQTRLTHSRVPADSTSHLSPRELFPALLSSRMRDNAITQSDSHAQHPCSGGPADARSRHRG